MEEITIAEQLLNTSNDALSPFTPEEVEMSFRAKLDSLGFEEVGIGDIVVEFEGDVFITFADKEGDEVEVVFGCESIYDETEEECYAMVVSEDDAQIVVDLDSLEPGVIETDFGRFVDVLDLSWLNKSTVGALLSAGNVDFGEGLEVLTTKEELDEFRRVKTSKKKTIIRGGKRMRIAVVKKVGKKRLSPKQKAALRKARRKAHTGAAKKKRKRSRKKRRTLGLKKGR
jgi:hypothetical protein